MRVFWGYLPCSFVLLVIIQVSRLMILYFIPQDLISEKRYSISHVSVLRFDTMMLEKDSNANRIHHFLYISHVHTHLIRDKFERKSRYISCIVSFIRCTLRKLWNEYSRDSNSDGIYVFFILIFFILICSTKRTTRVEFFCPRVEFFRLFFETRLQFKMKKHSIKTWKNLSLTFIILNCLF